MSVIHVCNLSCWLFVLCYSGLVSQDLTVVSGVIIPARALRRGIPGPLVIH